MKKIFLIILLLVIFYRQVYTFFDGWMTISHTKRLQSEESKYPHIINQNLSRNTRNIFITSESDGKIHFPDDEVKTSVSQISIYRPIGPVTSCHNSTFCEHAPDYPTDFVKDAIKSRNDLRYLVTMNENPETEIGERFASADKRPHIPDTFDDESLCLTQEQVVYPKTAENSQKEWVFVVNDDEFPQGVRIETCTSANGPCRIIDGFSEGYTTFCRQKYIYRHLAAIGSDGAIGPDLFRFPSSCCCHVKFTGDPAVRMGSGRKFTNKESSPRNKK
ncbi:hypothetical protein PV328_007189 [Microctonus aethiopoides]|uniref:Spaetzle domain-containing protein n=2 Tax=Microctonus aethiopoides TaxID=144406 RepID=A0AA39FR14_9HYME|nr:hypothetical protein PV328_007189 [Microctonus aethiopoides]